jgi:hypothetical protein
MKKKSVAGLFFSMFLRTVVIILAVVIVVFGVALTKQYMSRSKTANQENTGEIDESILSDPDDGDELLTASGDGEDGAETEQVVSSVDKKIVVLNGTTTKGLAGHWKDTLSGYGYTNIDSANYYNGEENTRILVTEDGIGQDLLQYFTNASIETGTLTSDDTDADLDGVQIIVIIGASDDVLSE